MNWGLSSLNKMGIEENIKEAESYYRTSQVFFKNAEKIKKESIGHIAVLYLYLKGALVNSYNHQR